MDTAMTSKAAALAAVALLAVPAFAGSSQRISDDDKIDILRGIEAEYAKAKVPIPRSKKALPYNSNGSFDPHMWMKVAQEYGPAARTGDLVQVTKITFEADRIVLQLNHGFRGGRHWYDNVQVGMGDPMGMPMPEPGTPVSGGGPAPGGTTIAILFHDKLPPVNSEDLKKTLSTILDFDPHSATKDYVSALPAPVKTAIQEKKAITGMDRDQVLLALGKPRTKDRQTIDGVDYEDWIYGEPPGKVTFVTFAGSKVVKVKEEYAAVGGSTVPNLPAQ